MPQIGIVESKKANHLPLSHSNNIGKYLLFALGMIVFIGSLVATGYLHSDMGNTTFAIAGGGAAFAIISLLLGHYCCTHSDSIRVSPTRKRGELVQVSNRLPCQRAGNSCFANTALQIVAHISPFRDLFDPILNPLEKDDKDIEEDSFSHRQKVQTLGMKLINKILQGKLVTKKELEQFITLVSKVAYDKGGYSTAKGDTYFFISDFLYILNRKKGSIPPMHTYGIGIIKDGELKETLEGDKGSNNWSEYPKILRMSNMGDYVYCPKIIMEGIGTYQLVAVALSTNYNPHTPDHQFGHAMPIVCTESGENFMIDDLENQVTKISEKKLNQILSKDTGWRSAYYVKVE